MQFIARLALVSALAVSTASAGNHHILHRFLHNRAATQIGDGQVQAPTGGASQIADGQVQAPTGGVSQLPDGQIQAPTGKPVAPAPPAPSPPAPGATTCGCTTYTTTWYGEPTWAPEPAPKPTTTSTPPAPKYTPPPPPPAPKPKPAPAPPAYKPSPAPAYKPSPAPSYGGQANGNKWAMTYTPYANNSDCKSADQIQQDIANIASKGFTTIRLYATDCGTLDNVGAACKQHNLKMLPGIFIDNSGVGSGSKAAGQLNDIKNWIQAGNVGLIQMVIAGNEAVFNGAVSASDLASFLGTVKSTLQGVGYSGPVTTTEPLGTLQSNSGTLCPAMDLATANIHPYFNPQTTAEEAGTFVASQLKDLKATCGGTKEAWNLETGWPSQGGSNGAAIAGSAEQATAVEQIMQHAGANSAMFSFENDMWKTGGQPNENWWGCGYLFQG